MSKNVNLNTLIKNDKISYRILRLLSNNDAISLMQTSKLFYTKVSQNKALYKNLIKNTNKDEIVFLKENQFLLNNHLEIEKIIKIVDEVYELFKKRMEFLIKIWVVTLLVCLMDLFPLLITLKAENYINSSTNQCFVLIPLTILFAVSLFILITEIILDFKKGKDIERVVFDKKELCFRNESNLKELVENIQIRYKNISFTTFENLLLIVVLIYIPILIKFHFIPEMTHELMLTISGSLLFGYSYLKLFIDFLVFKCNNWRSKIDVYNQIASRDSKFKEEFEKYKKTLTEMRSKICNETLLNIMFFISTAALYFLFIWYFKTLGSKLDNNNSISWVTLFIPFYIIELPVLIFCIVHSLAHKPSHLSRGETMFSSLIIFCGMLIDSVLIPLRLDETININYLVLSLLPIFISFLIFVHYRCVLS